MSSTRIISHVNAVQRLISAGMMLLGVAVNADAFSATAAPHLRVARFASESQVEVIEGANRKTLRPGERIGAWTLMEIVFGEQRYAVLENFHDQDGHILFVDGEGVRIDLPKTLESTAADMRGAYLGHSPEEIAASAVDLLGKQILAQPGDPQYAQIAAVFAPIRNIKWGTYSFIGTPGSIDKIGFAYGGRTANFDPAVYQPSIEGIRKAGNVWDGLVGGYLPVLRFVYPEAGSWTELLAFAPLRIDNANDRIQPVWYRVSRIENGELRWSRYVDSYPLFPPRTADNPKSFYADLVKLREGWNQNLAQAMTVDLPDERVANMARFSLVRAIMTRVGDFPKYGVYDRDYAGSEHDGFPDTFSVETTAMIEWGLLERAGRYIANYFDAFVRDDGSILYRGPETGQFGRMLTVLAQYFNAGGDAEILLRRRSRIDGITRLLLSMRETALQLPASDPAYGMLAGWSEADSSLEKDPLRYMRPYFSNSTEAARGLRELGKVWQAIGNRTANAQLSAWGEKLLREAAALQKDIEISISRSLLDVDGAKMLPAIAGATEPFDVAVGRDAADPQFRSYRAYMEMMYSGSLTPEQVRMIVNYRTGHHDVILGMPAAYNTAELAGFLSYGYGYGLIQNDMIREALLMMYSDMAHQYTRGTWMAPETRRPLSAEEAAPYCTPAQLVVALMTRWLLVFEDPESDTLWLGKALPRQWLEEGKTTAVSNAPTR